MSLTGLSGGGGCGTGLLLAPGLGCALGYFAATTVGGLTLSGDLASRERLILPVVLPTMHLSWGWGYLTSRVRIGPLPAQAPANP